MNDEGYSTTYDTVQEETVYELPDQPGENEGPLYHNIHEDLNAENNLYATELEMDEYESVPVDAVGGEENSLASSQPEEEGYPQFLAVCPEAPDPQPDEPQEDGNISMEELYSPIQDQEMSPEEPQENRSMMEEGNLPSPTNFTIQKSSENTLTCYSAADDLEESASMNPEINLFVKGTKRKRYLMKAERQRRPISHPHFRETAREWASKCQEEEKSTLALPQSDVFLWSLEINTTSSCEQKIALSSTVVLRETCSESLH